MPTSRDMVIFLLTTTMTTMMRQPITLPLAHARGVNMLVYSAIDNCHNIIMNVFVYILHGLGFVNGGCIHIEIEKFSMILIMYIYM